MQITLDFLCLFKYFFYAKCKNNNKVRRDLEQKYASKYENLFQMNRSSFCISNC